MGNFECSQIVFINLLFNMKCFKIILYVKTRIITSIFVSVVILYINCYSVNLATSVQNVFTAAKLVAVLIVILGGLYKMLEGKKTKHNSYCLLKHDYNSISSI